VCKKKRKVKRRLRRMKKEKAYRKKEDGSLGFTS